jgi:hypothetical protein
MSELYAITNLDGYATDVRQAAAEYICDNFSDSLDNYITIDQITNLVYAYSHGQDVKNHPMISQEDNESIFEEVLTWIHNTGLAKLASLDRLECAWDNDLNEMIFWSKENSDEPNRNNKHKNMESKKRDT